ncbi:dihydrodipicolinate synthase family protein [Actinokineospora enzanensis]|uniref:dihydrodipicolinate synthase family protein n=1 Tax=Actinokineospora enzanensis TaxID=155975 RepID=UPI0003693358|nr:dihydrodipicolinate synthase family protein [Actinokineospora enzanensis]
MTLTGLFVPLITPFTEDDHVDTAALTALAHNALTAGATGLLALGTTAEPATLTPRERATILAICQEAATEHHAPLLIGAGTNSTRATAQALKDLPEGTAAALVPVPPFTRPSPAGVIAHFQAIACHVPLIVYNVPHRTGTTLTAETLHRLASVPGVVGTKNSLVAIDTDTVAFMAAKPADFSVLAGDDVMLAPLLALGADGGILASAHLRTSDFADLIARPGRGHHLATLSAALFAEPNPAVIKAVLHERGEIATPAVRLPLLPASDTALARARSALALP